MYRRIRESHVSNQTDSFICTHAAHSRRQALESNATEFAAVLLMTFIAVSALSGLLGEAQVDYGVGVVHHAMTNASERFGDAHAVVQGGALASDAVRMRADNLVVSFNESDLPAEAFKLSVEALRCVVVVLRWSSACRGL